MEALAEEATVGASIVAKFVVPKSLVIAAMVSYTSDVSQYDVDNYFGFDMRQRSVQRR